MEGGGINEQIEVFKHKVIPFLCETEVNNFENAILLYKNNGPKGSPFSDDGKKLLAMVYDIAVLALKKVDKEVYAKSDVSQALSCLLLEWLAIQSLGVTEFLKSLETFVADNLKIPEVPKPSKNIEDKINCVLEYKITYGKTLRILIKTAMRHLSREEYKETLDGMNDSIVRIIQNVTESMQIPKSADFKDICVFGKENMVIYGQTLEVYLDILDEILHATDIEATMKVTKYVLKKSAATTVPLVLANLGKHDWTDEALRKQAEYTLRNICQISNCKSLEVLLVGTECVTKCEGSVSNLLFPRGLLGPILKHIRSRFNNDGWKQDPTLKHILLFATMNVIYPNLKIHIQILVSMLLEMVEDYKSENQVLGIGCLQHLIENVNPSDLNLYNHAAVIYDSLFKQLYGTKAMTLQVLLPCLLKILNVLESFPERLNASSMSSKWDIVIRKIITNMEYENKVQIRRIFAENLKYFVSKLGINTVKHLKNLLRLINSCLEFHDGEEEVARICTLDVLKVTVSSCWPVMSNHVGEILQALLRLIVDISMKDSFTSDKARTTLENLSLEIIVLLKKCCGVQLVDEYLNAALDADLDGTFRNVKDFIRTALELKLQNQKP